MVQKRPAEGRMEEVICERKPLGQTPHRPVGRIVIAHDETADVGPGHELVQFSTIDLMLLTVELMDGAAGNVRWLDEVREVERLIGKICWEA